MNRSLFGAIEPRQFLRRHWQKKPLLVRCAVSEIAGAFSQSELMALACRDDVESRLVMRTKGRWQVHHGPFRRRALDALPARGWTLLVQGVENHLPQARELVTRFGFIPYARHDDVMVSIAPPGGGVGPHFDSYDVFLLQASGKRRWRLSAQSDLRLRSGIPLRILERFAPEQSVDVEPGDLLYLPPQYAHDGVARSDCITCSIGFRAPSVQEICQGFLAWQQDHIDLEGIYADPQLLPQRHPAQISDAMLDRVERMIGALRWHRADIARYLGEYLTEPKAQTWFAPPRPPLGFASFVRRARRQGIRLALKSRMLFDHRGVYINGEHAAVCAQGRSALVDLADKRMLSPWPRAAETIANLLHQWYKCGYVELA
jgi:50S ribosomal protein L16 3-hydroxylase